MELHGAQNLPLQWSLRNKLGLLVTRETPMHTGRLLHNSCKFNTHVGVIVQTFTGMNVSEKKPGDLDLTAYFKHKRA